MCQSSCRPGLYPTQTGSCLRTAMANSTTMACREVSEKHSQSSRLLIKSTGLSTELPSTSVQVSIQIACFVPFKCFTNFSGNWSPSDFPEGTTFAPRSRTKHNINRDLLVSMEGADIVQAFQTVFENDWKSGTDWYPKNR